MKKLTHQQKLFVTEYIKTLDGAHSARLAGFKVKDFKLYSDTLLRNEIVINEIKSELQKQIASLNISKGYVIQKLLQIAEFSLFEEEILDKDGAPTGKTKFRDTPAALKALESLCKYLGFSKEQSIYKEAKIVTIANLDDNKI